MMKVVGYVQKQATVLMVLEACENALRSERRPGCSAPESKISGPHVRLRLTTPRSGGARSRWQREDGQTWVPVGVPRAFAGPRARVLTLFGEFASSGTGALGDDSWWPCRQAPAPKTQTLTAIDARHSPLASVEAWKSW